MKRRDISRFGTDGNVLNTPTLLHVEEAQSLNGDKPKGCWEVGI